MYSILENKSDTYWNAEVKYYKKNQKSKNLRTYSSFSILQKYRDRRYICLFLYSAAFLKGKVVGETAK